MGFRGSRWFLVGDCCARQMLVVHLVHPETKYRTADRCEIRELAHDTILSTTLCLGDASVLRFYM